MSQDARFDQEITTQKRARLLGFDYVDTTQINPKSLFSDLLSNQEMSDMRVVPLEFQKSFIRFGITNNTSQSTMSMLRQRFSDYRLSFSLISDAGFNEYMRLYNPPKQVIYQDISLHEAGSAGLVQQISGLLDQVRADDMLAYLVAQAHRLNASDIHLETQADVVRIRFRIDGVLHTIARLTFDKYRILVAAIASGGDISTASNQAQQGHIAQKVTMADHQIVNVNVRLETVPTVNGMDIVMRLFNMDQDRFTLDRLGLSEAERHELDGIISKPSGLVMIVGPTGAGKTTTLYSILNSLNNDERKIVTIEDPVEYQFKGVTQVPVQSSESGTDSEFANKLRAVLRLDPDIVMVGEVRDDDTAHTALQAALTGHLVLTSFHAADAASALTRLSGIIGHNPLFISAIRLIMAQRLVRRLDDASKEAYEPSEAERQIIFSVLDSLPVGMPRPNLENFQLFRPKQSSDNPYGFRGQLAIREQLMMTGQVRSVLEDRQNVITNDRLAAAAVSGGMVTILQDAILKVLTGQTTLSEVFRVLG